MEKSQFSETNIFEYHGQRMKIGNYTLNFLFKPCL